jgi:hypothetical protein
MMPIKELFYNIQSSLPGWLGGLSDEEAKVKREQLDAEYKDLDDRATARKLKREEIQLERGTHESQKKVDAQGNEISARQLKAQELDFKFQNQMAEFKDGAATKYNRVNQKEMEVLDGKAKLQKKTMDVTETALANLPKEKNFNDSMMLLKQEALQQKSKFISPKDQTKSNTPTTSSVNATITPTATTEEQNTTKPVANTSAGGGTTQTTSTTENVFAELNTNVVELVKLTNQQLRMQGKTVGAIENLSNVGNLLKSV